MIESMLISNEKQTGKEREKEIMAIPYASRPCMPNPTPFSETFWVVRFLLSAVWHSLFTIVLLANWTLVHGFYYYASKHVYLVCLVAPIGSIVLLLLFIQNPGTETYNVAHSMVSFCI